MSQRPLPLTDLSRVVANGNHLACNLAGEAVILNLENGVYYGVNPDGTCVWNLIQEPRTFADVRDTLLEEFDVEPTSLEADLRALPQQLAEHGLIKITE
ncbi:MAG TPA: PqqD family protein [Vicinamibacterales bacterium]|jgi:hypothetical protein|nr:PqqD family protein [Vicinamibacterales bacterium]